MYRLRYYITGRSQSSQVSIEHLKKILDKKIGKYYHLKVIDILKNPVIAEKKKIVVTPLLERILPKPIRRIVGDLSDKDKVIVGLDLDSIKKGGKRIK
jgi:circadian clock protein KaiB